MSKPRADNVWARATDPAVPVRDRPTTAEPADQPNDQPGAPDQPGKGPPEHANKPDEPPGQADKPPEATPKKPAR